MAITFVRSGETVTDQLTLNAADCLFVQSNATVNTSAARVPAVVINDARGVIDNSGRIESTAAQVAIYGYDGTETTIWNRESGVITGGTVHALFINGTLNNAGLIVAGRGTAAAVVGTINNSESGVMETSAVGKDAVVVGGTLNNAG